MYIIYQKEEYRLPPKMENGEMKKQEIRIAKELLGNRAERIEMIKIENGGYAITAHWVDGGQKKFDALEDVKAHCEK